MLFVIDKKYINILEESFVPSFNNSITNNKFNDTPKVTKI